MTAIYGCFQGSATAGNGAGKEGARLSSHAPTPTRNSEYLDLD
jgi:hypothetical protein